jgi:UrcA family protein
LNTITHPKDFRRMSATAVCGVIASIFVALPAAADSLAPLKEKVKFGDLDVSRPQDAARLYSRIRAAAERVCSPFDAAGLAAKQHLDACINKAISEAVTTVDRPALSRVYGAKRGTSLPISSVSVRAAEVEL